MEVTSKTKKHIFGHFRDAMRGVVPGHEHIDDELGLRYTMICRELLPMMLVSCHFVIDAL